MTSSFHDSFENKKEELIFDLERQQARDKQVEEVTVEAPRFLFRLGREPVALSLVEFKIIRFLSQKPYKAFTREQIVSAIHSDHHPVTDDNLDDHIRGLRDKLGLFSDYIQTVPYIGFRVKP